MTVERDETELSVADAVSGQLDFERTRHASLEQRGAIVISTSGALITLLFALAGVTARSSGSKVVGLPLISTWLALICLLSAAGLGIYLNKPHTSDFKSVPMPVLKKLVESGGESQAEYIHEQMCVIERVTTVNDRNSRFLVAAFIAEALGIALLGLAAWIIL